MKFTKMQGAGNDFVIVNNFEEHLPEGALPELARDVCARRLGIGADGLMVVDRALQGGDYRMLFYNADGSLGEMCGNGARCIARFGYEHGLSGETQRIETTAGLVLGQRIDQTHYRIRLNDPSIIDLERSALAGGTRYETPYVELGDPGLPHAVVHRENWPETPEAELRALGSALRYSPAFPKGANVTFWKEVAPEHIAVRTFERGVEDFTLACGTGCGSTVAVLTLLGVVAGREVQVDCPGGTLTLSVRRDGAQIRDIYLTGPTRVVAEGFTVE